MKTVLVAISVAAMLSLVGCKKEKRLGQTPPAGDKESAKAGGKPEGKPAGPPHEEEGAGKAPGANPKLTPTLEDPGAKEPKLVTRAVAVLYPTKGHKARGIVSFEATDKGVKVQTVAEGLPKGKHGYHLHLYGDCTGIDGKTAGTHFNLSGSSKNPPEDVKRITGNLGELEAGKDGKAKGETMLENATLQGEFSIIGRAVIVHAKGNDPSKPPIGAAGARLACGVVGITEAP